MTTPRDAAATLVLAACLATAIPEAGAQVESQLTLVRKGQRANGIAQEYGRTAGNTDYLKELSPECYMIFDVPVFIHKDYDTVFGAGDVQKADLVRGGATVLFPGWRVTDAIQIPFFAQLTSTYTTVKSAGSDTAKQGTELSDFLVGTGVQYRDWGILHAGLIQSKETVYASDLKTSEKESAYSPFVSLLLPFLDISINSLNGIDYLNIQAARLGRYAKIPSSQKGFSQTNDLSLGFTRIGPARQNNAFLRVADLLGYVDAGVEVDVAAGDLRAVTAGVSYLWEWTKMFLELRADGSVYKDRRITERVQMIDRVSADEAAKTTDHILGGRAGVHLGLRRDYLYGPRDLSWYHRLIPARGAFEMSYNDKEILQGFYDAYNHVTAYGKVVWDVEPTTPSPATTVTENPPSAPPTMPASPAAAPPADTELPPSPPPAPSTAGPKNPYLENPVE